MKKFRNLLLSGLLVLSMMPTNLIQASEKIPMNEESEEVVPLAAERWYGKQTFQFGGKTVIIEANVSMLNNKWSYSARVTNRTGKVVNCAMDTVSSSVHGNVNVGGVLYLFSVRVFPK